MTGVQTCALPIFDARNASTGTRYRGANTVTLAVTALDAGYPSGSWATYRQWSDLCAQVRRGETGARIVKWVPGRTTDAPDPTGEGAAPGRPLVPKVYAVFNVAQVDGWTPPESASLGTVERDSAADAWIAATGAQLTYGHDHACYRPALDRIELPDPGAFADTESFYGTVLHELTHWTGHRSRLARDLSGRFGDDAYAAEELVAELGAAIACAHLTIAPTPRDDHAGYLAHWLTILRADPKALFTAAAKAQTAVDHLDTYSTKAVTP